MVFPGSRAGLMRSSHFLPRFKGASLRDFNRSDAPHSQPRRGTRSNAQHLGGGGGGPLASAAGGWWPAALTLPATAAAAALLGSGLALAFTKQQQDQEKRAQLQDAATDTSSVPRGNLTDSGWPRQVAQEPGAVRVLTAEALLAQDHPFLEDDHMFSAFVARGIINDMEGWYIPKAKKFDAIVSLGREVAGFPRVVHGGLTAAIFDEAFGGLLFSLKKSGGVNFWGPAYTVQLEVSYKAKIPAGATILCAAEVDSVKGRKLWMKATMSDGPDGTVYATAKALFVAPKPTRLIVDVVKYLASRAGEVLPGRGGGQRQQARAEAAGDV